MFIYVIVCSETLKIYIGQHKGQSLAQYLRSKWYAAHHRLSARSRLYVAMRKYPRGSWSIHPLVSGVETRLELDGIEKHFIRVLKTQHPDVGYNICRGGEGFTGPHTAEALQKMSRSQKKVHRTPERRQIASNRFREMWANPDMKQKISQAIRNAPSETRFHSGIVPWNAGTQGIMKPNTGSFGRGRPQPENSGAKGPNKTSFKLGHTMHAGKKYSDEHRRNLSLSHLGHPNSDTGKKRSEATKQKMRDAWIRRKARTDAL